MKEKAQHKFINYYLKLKLEYGYHSETMFLANWIKDSYCFKICCAKILRSINWQIPPQQMIKENIPMLHKIIKTVKPHKLDNLIRNPMIRKAAKMTMKYKVNNEI